MGPDINLWDMEITPYIYIMSYCSRGIKASMDHDGAQLRRTPLLARRGFHLLVIIMLLPAEVRKANDLDECVKYFGKKYSWLILPG